MQRGCALRFKSQHLHPNPHSLIAVAWIAQVLAAAPRLQAVELLGLAPESAEALLPVWERAQRARGRQGYAAPAADGGLRLSVSER